MYARHIRVDQRWNRYALTVPHAQIQTTPAGHETFCWAVPTVSAQQLSRQIHETWLTRITSSFIARGVLAAKSARFDSATKPFFR